MTDRKGYHFKMREGSLLDQKIIDHAVRVAGEKEINPLLTQWFRVGFDAIIGKIKACMVDGVVDQNKLHRMIQEMPERLRIHAISGCQCIIPLVNEGVVSLDGSHPGSPPQTIVSVPVAETVVEPDVQESQDAPEASPGAKQENRLKALNLGLASSGKGRE